MSPVATQEKSPEPTKVAGEFQRTNSADVIDLSIVSKEVSTLMAKLALAGHAVHKGLDGGFTVSRWAYSYHCKNLDELRDFATRLEASHALQS